MAGQTLADPRVLAVGTAVPPHRVTQEEAREAVRVMFAGAYRDVGRLVTVFDNGLVRTRYWSAPLDYFLEARPWPERNALYGQVAVDLGEQAALSALSRARVRPDQVDAIIFVSTTGIATPSLDSLLIKRLGMGRHSLRLPIFGLGCTGGAAGLNRAADLVRARPDRLVLLVAVELSSLTFQRHDMSKSNLVAASLFSDGAAAVLVGPGEGPALVGSHSTLWDDSEDVMGWDVNDDGLRVRFARSVPDIVRELIRPDVEAAARANGLSFADLRHFVTHPGGLKVLQAFSEALSLPRESLDDSYAVLQEYGNMSSASVLFVLERLMRRWPELPSGEAGIITAMGPGFSAEHSFFRT